MNNTSQIEEILQNADSTPTLSELKQKLPKINNDTLKITLENLEEKGKIVMSDKGITWIHNNNLQLREAIRTGREL